MPFKMTESFTIDGDSFKFFLSVEVNFNNIDKSIVEKYATIDNFLIKCKQKKYIGFLREVFAKIIQNWFININLHILKDDDTLCCIQSIIKYVTLCLLQNGIAISYVPIPIIYSDSLNKSLMILRSDNLNVLNVLGCHTKLNKSAIEEKSAIFLNGLRDELQKEYLLRKKVK